MAADGKQIHKRTLMKRKRALASLAKAKAEAKAPETPPPPQPLPPPPEPEPAQQLQIQNPQSKIENLTREVNRYGLIFPNDPSLINEAGHVNEVALELLCYRMRLKTGKPREWHFRRAFNIVWPDFQWNDWMELMAWAWCNYRLVSVIGHSRASKTYGAAHFALLDYLAADSMTATSFTTTKFDALRGRIWGDMLKAIDTCGHYKDYLLARYRIQTASNELKFSIRSKEKLGDDKFIIQGIATDSADESAGKLRGQHADRRRIIVDEAQDVADAVYAAFLNAMSAEDFLGLLLSNPVDKQTTFGEWCRPKNGWGSITDRDLQWETAKGGICLHLDGLQSPNIKAGKTVFPFLLTQDYVDDVKRVEGEDSLKWWMYVRGFFAPDGMVPRVWPSQAIERALEDAEFDFKPEWWGSLDAGFEEGDDCVLMLARKGRLRDGRPCCVAAKSIVIPVKSGGETPADYQIAHEVMRVCKAQGVEPENFIMDTTGNARGVYAILQVEWSAKVHKLAYNGEATERPMRLNDSLGANRQVRYFVAELWFRASYLAREGMLCGLGNVSPKTREDLEARRYTAKQYGKDRVMVVESKREMRKRINRSPDHGDTFCQFGELMVRKGLIGGAGGMGSRRGQWELARKRAVKAAILMGTEWEKGTEGLKG
jgi:hypothetical protein